MADDYNSETTLGLSQERKLSEIPKALNKFNLSQEQPAPNSSSSDLKNDVVQEAPINSVDLPNNCSSVISHGDDKDVVCDVVPREPGERLKKAGDSANETVSRKQEEKGFEEDEAKVEKICLEDAVLEERERGVFGGGEEVEKGNNDRVLEKGEKDDSGIEGRLDFDGKMNDWADSNEGSVKKCSLKIAVIDETALIEASEIGKGFSKERKIVKNVNNNNQENGGNNVKRPRRRGKSGKNKNSGTDEKGKNLDLGLSHNDCGMGNLDGFEEKRQKNVYSRKELEGLRHVGLEWQRKNWAEIYCGLAPVVQKEYDGIALYDYHRQNCNQQQKKYIRVDSNGGPSIFGEEFSEKIADNDIAFENPMDPTSGLPTVNNENGCLIEQECVEDDSDEEYSSIQKPAFFVSGEPDFDSGPPEDGLEYLRRVRWEAVQIPKVKVVKVDRSKLNKDQTLYMPQIPDVAKCPEHLMPLKEWEDAFLADFSELRLALSRSEDLEDQMQSSSVVYKEEESSKLLENFDNMSAVGDSCESAEYSTSQTCDDTHSPSVVNENDGSDLAGSPSSKISEREAAVKYPTLSMITRMDCVARVSMLRKHINMAESMSNLSRNDCLWLFSLSAAVDCPVDADTCAAFRSLLRKCASLRAEKLVFDEEVAMLNILTTISGRYFGQLEK